MDHVPLPGISKPRSAVARWGDRLITLLAVGALAVVGAKYLAPRPSAPLDALAHQQVAPPGHVTLFEVGQTHCPACVASRPILALLDRQYGGRATLRTVNLDAPDDREEANRLAALAQVHYTPTFLVTDVHGRAIAKFVGPTSYLALAAALDRALAAR